MEMELAPHLTAMAHLMGVVDPATGHPRMVVDEGVVMEEVEVADGMEARAEDMEVVE